MANARIDSVRVGPGLSQQILHRLHEQAQAPYRGHIQRERHRREGHRKEQLQHHHLISGSEEARNGSLRMRATMEDPGITEPFEIRTEEGEKERRSGNLENPAKLMKLVMFATLCCKN